MKSPSDEEIMEQLVRMGIDCENQDRFPPLVTEEYGVSLANTFHPGAMLKCSIVERLKNWFRVLINRRKMTKENIEEADPV